MTKYREIIRLAGLNLSQTNIALSCNASKTTVNKVLKAAREQNLVWPLDPKLSDPVLGLTVMVLYKPRTWCTFCPMGTMTQGICKLKNNENK